MQAEHEQRHPELVAAFETQKSRSYLYFGFTTVVDLFGNANDNAQWNTTQIGPDAYFCGGAPIANGYPMIFTPEEVRFRAARYFLYDERQTSEIPDYVDPEQHTPVAVVERMASDGAICVKTHHETGFCGLRDLPTPALETVRALVEAAHAEALPVILHANSQSAQQFAVEAGVDVIAHGLSVETGKKAHLLLLGENPLDNVEAYDTIELVILGGVPIERASLSAANSADR